MGGMRHANTKIDIQQLAAPIRAADGDPNNEVWSDRYADVPARFNWKGAGEKITLGKREYVIDAKILIQVKSGVIPTDQVVHGSDIYEIIRAVNTSDNCTGMILSVVLIPSRRTG